MPHRAQTHQKQSMHSSMTFNGGQEIKKKEINTLEGRTVEDIKLQCARFPQNTSKIN